MFMSADDYRESLRRHRPVVFVDGHRVDSVADEPAFAPGIRALGVTYDFALRPELAPLMTAVQHTSGRVVNRMLGDLRADLQGLDAALVQFVRDNPDAAA